MPWAIACDVWDHDSYLSPMLKLLVLEVRRHLKEIEDATKEDIE